VLWNSGRGKALQLVNWGGHALLKPQPLASTLAALSGNKFLPSLLHSTVVFFLVTTSAAKPLQALARTRGTDSWLDGIDIDKNFGPDLPLLFKMHENWSVDSQENY